MGKCREERLCLDYLKQNATFVRYTKHGELWRLASGDHQQLSGTPGDWRSWKNAWAELKRKEGIGEEKKIEEEKKEPQEAAPVKEEDVTGENQRLGGRSRTWDSDLSSAILKEWRESNKFSYNQAADALGVQHGRTIAKWEEGSSTPTKAVQQRLRDLILGKSSLEEKPKEPQVPQVMLKIQKLVTKTETWNTAFDITHLRELLQVNDRAVVSVKDQDGKEVKWPLLVKVTQTSEVVEK